MKKTVQEILSIFELFRMAPIPTIDRYEQEGKALFADKVEGFVNKNEPIMFFMLGYPFKSLNKRDKVLGTLPDLTEEVSLKNFARFNDAIKTVYTPGVQIHIASDGYVFNDILGAFDATVRQYEEITKAMCIGTPVFIHNLTDFYSSNLGRLSDIREKLMMQFGPSEELLQHRILNEPDTTMLYRGMSIFMEEELAIKEYDSRNQMHKAAKILTREMMRRNEAFGAMVQHEFSDMVKISMHNSTNVKKLAFNLYPTAVIPHGSPWHVSMLVKADGTMETIKRKDAESAGHQLIYKDKQPYYFLQTA